MHDRWMIRRSDGSMRVQACLSPVWDSALALLAMLESEVEPSDPASSRPRAGSRRKIRVPGDWCVWVRGVKPSGWSSSSRTISTPTSTTPRWCCSRCIAPGRCPRACARVRSRWIFAMQSKNGGWAAFDKDNTSRWPALIPFADFGEMIDPPSADVTAHVVEMLGVLGFDHRHPAVARAIAYLYAQQESDGSWFGRWGVNHVYGVGAVLPALAAVGAPRDSVHVRRAVRWLFDRQNLDGGFGESCESYVVAASRGRGASTPSQTAWALLTLIAADRADSPSAVRAVGYLTGTQRSDGGWDEEAFTGCGFPGYGGGEARSARSRQGRELASGFMLRYHLYRNCFPLLALGRYRDARKPAGEIGRAP